MISFVKKILNIIILSISLFLAGIITNYFIPGVIEKSSLTILTISFSLLSIIVVGLVQVGSNKSSESQTLYSLAAVGLKFVISAIIALLYFTGFKKYGLNNVILFFVLYLTFAIYMIAVIVKVLNARSLKSGQV